MADHKKYMAQRVLEFIASSKRGRTYGEIQEFICRMKGLDYGEMKSEQGWSYGRNEPTPDVIGRRWRGIWGDNLHRLLPTFCVKDGQRRGPGRWRVVKPIRRPFYGPYAGMGAEERETTRIKNEEIERRYREHREAYLLAAAKQYFG